jgi:arogenate dehydrogenase (NADP+)
MKYKIGIVGLGLIGGSIAKDLKCAGYQIYGVDLDVATCEKSISDNIVVDASIKPDIIGDCDIVFIAVPIDAVVNCVKLVMPYLKSGAVLTDVASVKKNLVPILEDIYPHYIGGHPMAGTADIGYYYSKQNLFKDHPYVITSTIKTKEHSLNILNKVLKALNCNIVHTTPEMHDEVVAWISHLPVVVSASLLKSIESITDQSIFPFFAKLAGSGFRDTTRVGGGNPELGKMMAQYNKPFLLNAINGYIKSLQEIQLLIEQEDWNTLNNVYVNTKNTRASLVK